MTQRGILDRVETTTLGAGLTIPATVGDTTLTVDWTNDFDDTGTLLLGDLTYTYTRPDDDETTLLLDTALTVAADEGDPVYALDDNGQQQRLVQAWVQLDEGQDPLPFRLLSDLEGRITEDTPAGTAVTVSLASGQVLGLGVTATDYTGQTTQIDPETGEQSSAVTEAGDATVRDLNATGTTYTAPDRVDLGGYSLADQFASQPAGRLRGGSRLFASPLPIGTTYAPLYSMDLMLEDDRSVDFAHEVRFDSTVASQPFTLTCFRTWSATEQPAAATTADEPFYSLECETAGQANTVLALTPETKRSLPAGYNRFTIAARTPSGSVRATGDHRVMVTDQGPALFEDAFYFDDGAGGGESAGPQPQPTLVVDAVATQWYNGDANNTPRGNGANQYFGRVSTQPTEGNRKSAIWFPATQIRNALAGATVTKVELYLYLFSAAGGSSTVVIGSHNSTSWGERWENINGKAPNKTQAENFRSGTSRWVNLGAGWNLTNWATTYGGVLIGPGPDASNLYAGGYSGMGSGSARLPKLRISYSR